MSGRTSNVLGADPPTRLPEVTVTASPILPAGMQPSSPQLTAKPEPAGDTSCPHCAGK
jgi:hypothetical protein